MTWSSQDVWPRVRRLACWLAVPACVLGILLYPDIREQTMSLPAAGAILAGVAILFAVTRQFRLMVLLPLVAAFLPSMQAGFLAYMAAIMYAAVAFGPRRFVQPMDGLDWAIVAVLACSVVSWLVNLGVETDPWSLPLFGLTFLSPWVLLWLVRVGPWSTRDLLTSTILWLALIMAQLAPALIEPLVRGTPASYAMPLGLLNVGGAELLAELLVGNIADLTAGSMRSAHHLGAVLIVCTVVVAATAALSRSRGLGFAALALCFVFLMTDSKHLVLAAVPVMLLLAVPVLWPLAGPISRRLVLAVVAVASVSTMLWVGPRLIAGAQATLWEPYVKFAELNPKYRLVTRTSARITDDKLAIVLGYGPGSFGSRAATMRATEVLFKESQQLPAFIPSHAGQSYAAVAQGLFTSEVARATQFRSGALTNPFSSVVGLVAEFGLVGTTAFLVMIATLAAHGLRRWQDCGASPLDRAISLGVAFSAPFLLLAGVFDSYLEQPDVTAPVVVLAVLALSSAAGTSAARSVDQRV